MSNDAELEYQTYVTKYFRAFVRFSTMDKGKHTVEKTFKRWWITKAPTRLSMINNRGKKENKLSRLKVDIWNKIKEAM